MALSRFTRDPFFDSSLGFPTATRDPFEDFFTSALQPFGQGAAGTRAMIPTMTLDVKEDDKGYQVMADVPGLNKEDINVTFEDNLLKISAEKREEKNEQNERYHLQERRWGSVSRQIRLPRNCQGENISASYKDGVLCVTVPKSPEQQGRKAIRVD